MALTINSVQTREQAHAVVEHALHGESPRDALLIVDALRATANWTWALDELRGVTRIELGAHLHAADLVREGIALLDHALPPDSHHTDYNRANGLHALWEISLRADGLTAALVTSRQHLHRARRIFERIGRDETAESVLRVQALINAGNSYDTLGRDQDALALWAEALAIDPSFAMARGNRGLALFYATPFAGEHAGALAVEAAHELDAALQAPEDVLRYGDPGSLEHFQRVRAKLPAHADLPKLPDAAHGVWNDPHADWCRRHQLFLHASHRCLRDTDKHLDPLFFSALTGPTGPGAIERANNLTDSINALKQEFVAVRFTTWLALDRDSTIATEAAAIKARVRFLDSFNYARWGVRSGMVVQAFVSTTNLLDKIAVVTHAYFDTGRSAKKTYFRAFWRAKVQGQEGMETAFENAFALGWNPGLAALCDLSNDLEDQTPLSRLVAMRHAATHRLLIAHEIEPPADSEWITRVDYEDFASRSLEQLHLARAAIVYLLRAIDAHEHHLERTREYPLVPIATFDVDPSLTELD